MQEVFRDVKGYEGLYQVSDFGRIKSLARKGCLKHRILKPHINIGGYYAVNLYNGKPKNHKIHQLEAIAFLNHVPCGLKIVVDHKDFDKLNNYLPNLRLITNRENTNRKHLKSTSKYTGVYWYKRSKKWIAFIYINGKSKYLGLFTNELQASNAYQIALKKSDLQKVLNEN